MAISKELQARLDQASKDFPLRNLREPTPPEKQRRKKVTDQHTRACLMKVEEGLSDAEIARQIGVTPQCVSLWWKKLHVQRELRRIKERFNSETRPAIIQRSEQIREKGMVELERRIDHVDTKTSDVIGGIKLTNEMIDRAVEQEIEDDEKAGAKEEEDRAWNALTSDEQDRLARRIGLGSKEPVFIDEAEVIDAEITEDAVIGSGDTQEESIS